MLVMYNFLGTNNHMNKSGIQKTLPILHLTVWNPLFGRLERKLSPRINSNSCSESKGNSRSCDEDIPNEAIKCSPFCNLYACV